MEITLKEVIECQQALRGLLSIKLPIKISYRLTKLNNKLLAEYAVYEEQRISLVKKLGEQVDPKIDSWQVKMENIPEYSAEIKKLQEEVVKIDFEKIKLEDLGPISIEPANLPEAIFE